MNKELRDIFHDHEFKLRDANNVPAKLVRKILCEIGMTPKKWDELVNEYYKSPYCPVPRNKIAIASDKNNFNRSIAKNDVSWAKAMRVLLILCPVRITVSIKLQWRSGTVTEHSQSVQNPMKKLIEKSSFEPEAEALNMNQKNVLGDAEV